MRIRTGHGPNDWSLNVPSEPLSPKHVRGSLIQGDPGVVEKTRIHAGIQRAAARARVAEGAPPPEPRKQANRARFYATDEERLAARAKSFRESKARQRARRAQLRAEVEMMRLERAS